MHLLTDVFETFDPSYVTFLALFDINAAFHTVDHSIQLQHLETFFSVSGLPLRWISPFLSARSQAVIFWAHAFA